MVIRSKREPPGEPAAVTPRDAGSSTGRHRGIVKRLVSAKGFGFLQSHTDGKEYFFHRSALPDQQFDELVEGDEVTWSGMTTMKGPRATNIERQ